MPKIARAFLQMPPATVAAIAAGCIRGKRGGTVDGDGRSTHQQQGAAARWAMQVYLATLGRHKVGFSLVPERADNPSGPLQPVTGVRALLERN